jgi:hypothetical protein
MPPVSAMASAKTGLQGGPTLPSVVSQNATPTLSCAIPSANLAFPDEGLARCHGRQHRPQHGQAILPTQPLTFFGALA